MPPIRTSANTKPVRTERTHEENQERAYIAASRRSDRSLEARIESARRASEIHKKRTGRALRVTEQDVVNEEMYEEEDEDLPAQIRRLQQFAHLQTNSDNFNYRLHNYMASHIGTRQALMNQAQFANTPFFSNQFAPPQPTTMLPPQMFHYNQSAQQFAPSAGVHSPAGVNIHGRSASLSGAPGTTAASSASTSPSTAHASDGRRMSMPTQTAQSSPGSQPQTPSTLSAQQSAVQIKQEDEAGITQHLSSPQQSYAPLSTVGYGFSNANFAPFSTSLPQETQQLLTAPSNMGDGAFNPYFFSTDSTPVSYSYKLTPSSMATAMDPSLSMAQLNTSISSPSDDGYITSAHTDFGWNDAAFGDSLKLNHLSRHNSNEDDGNVTPGGTDWQNFIDTSFEDLTADGVFAVQ